MIGRAGGFKKEKQKHDLRGGREGNSERGEKKLTRRTSSKGKHLMKGSRSLTSG